MGEQHAAVASLARFIAPSTSEETKKRQEQPYGVDVIICINSLRDDENNQHSREH